MKKSFIVTVQLDMYRPRGRLWIPRQVSMAGIIACAHGPALAYPKWKKFSSLGKDLHVFRVLLSFEVEACISSHELSRSAFVRGVGISFPSLLRGRLGSFFFHKAAAKA
jgi:hypothetical protein